MKAYGMPRKPVCVSETSSPARKRICRHHTDRLRKMHGNRVQPGPQDRAFPQIQMMVEHSYLKRRNRRKQSAEIFTASVVHHHDMRKMFFELANQRQQGFLIRFVRRNKNNREYRASSSTFRGIQAHSHCGNSWAPKSTKRQIRNSFFINTFYSSVKNERSGDREPHTITPALKCIVFRPYIYGDAIRQFTASPVTL